MSTLIASVKRLDPAQGVEEGETVGVVSTRGLVVEIAGGVGGSFLRFPGEKPVDRDGDGGKGEVGSVGRCGEIQPPGGEFGVASPPTV